MNIRGGALKYVGENDDYDRHQTVGSSSPFGAKESDALAVEAKVVLSNRQYRPNRV